MDHASLKELFGCWAMMWAGQALHLLRVFKDLEDVTNGPTAWGWVKAHPWSIVYSMVAGFTAYGVLYSTNQLTPIGALACGYMADSIVNALLSKEKRRIEGQ